MEAYRNGRKILYNQAKNKLTKEIYVLKSLKEIPNYKTMSPNSVGNQQLADSLNDYCRFENPSLSSPHTNSDGLFAHPSTPPATPPPPAFQISEENVHWVFRKQKTQTVYHQPV